MNDFEILGKLKEKAKVIHKHKLEDITDIEKIVEPYAKKSEYVKNDVLEKEIKALNNKVNNISLNKPKDRENSY